MPDINITCRPQEKVPLKAVKVKDIQKQLAFIPVVYRGFYTALTSVSDTTVASEIDDYSDIEQEPNQLPSDDVRSRSKQAKTAVKTSAQNDKLNSAVSRKRAAVSGSKRSSCLIFGLA